MLHTSRGRECNRVAKRWAIARPEAGRGLVLLHAAAVLRLDHAYPRGHSLGQLRAVSDDAYHPSVVGGAVPLQVEPVKRVGDGLERFLVQRAEPFVEEE